jgi:Tfp pilus assembly protein PilN
MGCLDLTMAVTLQVEGLLLLQRPGVALVGLLFDVSPIEPDCTRGALDE